MYTRRHKRQIRYDELLLNYRTSYLLKHHLLQGLVNQIKVSESSFNLSTSQTRELQKHVALIANY